jgi:hypothetical protein
MMKKFLVGLVALSIMVSLVTWDVTQEIVLGIILVLSAGILTFVVSMVLGELIIDELAVGLVALARWIRSRRSES